VLLYCQLGGSRIIDFVATFVFFFAVVDLIGSVPVFMLGAGRIHRVIGDSGVSIISRVMGLILASVATTNALSGIKEYFALQIRPIATIARATLRNPLHL